MGSSQLAALDAIEHYALSSPNSLALLEPDGLTLSYKDLWAQIQTLSDRLEQAGIGAGERVAVLLPEGALHVLAVTGVLNRHVVILLSARTASVAAEPTLRKLSASALITAPEFESEIEVAVRLGMTVLVAGKGESPGNWGVRATALPFKKRSEQSGPGLFLFSSGTTGASKVVFWSDANINAGIAFRQLTTQLTSSDRLLFMITICNGAGVINALTQFTAGGSIIATSGFDHSAFVHWLNQLKPTWYVCAPIVHQASLAALREGVIDHPVSLRFLESAGAPLNKDVQRELERILGVPVLNVYGANEVQYVARKTHSPGGLDPNPDSAGVSCGLEIGIMDSFGMFLPTGEGGEIAVRGPTVASGYFDNPQATQAAFQDGWFRTGDLGRLDQVGNLFVTGRLKEMINRGGEKIVPGEVDAAFESHPSVLEAASFAVPHPTLGEDLACAVVLRTGTEPQVSARELRRYATGHLASFKVPHRIYFVDEIPRGELGKPLRWVLAEQLSGTNAATQTPAEVTEQLAAEPITINLHEIWSRILGRDDLSLNEDFFEAGGDSLAAINMLAEIDERFGSHTSAMAASFADEPSLTHLTVLVRDTLAEHPAARDDSSNLQLFPVHPGASDAKLFCVPPEGIEGLAYRRLAKHLHGEMDLVIARPVNTQYSRSLFTFERYGAEAAALIRQMQPVGPYFVSGHCFGGIVAVETARQLANQGQEVRVILFDALTPGFPRLMSQWRSFLGGIKRQLHRLWTSAHPGLTYNVREFSRRVLWTWMIPFRQILLPVEHVPFIQRIIQWGQGEYFPYYKARDVDAPLLHILSTIDSVEIHSDSRIGWRSIARAGIEERNLTLDNWNFFHESNLPAIAETILRWCGTSTKAVEVPQVCSKKNDFL